MIKLHKILPKKSIRILKKTIDNPQHLCYNITREKEQDPENRSKGQVPGARELLRVVPLIGRRSTEVHFSDIDVESGGWVNASVAARCMDPYKCFRVPVGRLNLTGRERVQWMYVKFSRVFRDSLRSD